MNLAGLTRIAQGTRVDEFVCNDRDRCKNVNSIGCISNDDCDQYDDTYPIEGARGKTQCINRICSEPAELGNFCNISENCADNRVCHKDVCTNADDLSCIADAECSDYNEAHIREDAQSRTTCLNSLCTRLKGTGKLAVIFPSAKSNLSVTTLELHKTVLNLLKMQHVLMTIFVNENTNGLEDPIDTCAVNDPAALVYLLKQWISMIRTISIVLNVVLSRYRSLLFVCVWNEVGILRPLTYG